MEVTEEPVMTYEPPLPLPLYQQWVERVARPVRLASQATSSHLLSYKNLGTYISSQVVNLLGAAVWPSSVEADLLALRQLFFHFDTLTKGDERQACVRQGVVVVDRLQAYLSSVSPHASSLPSLPASQEHRPDSTRHGKDEEGATPPPANHQNAGFRKFSQGAKEGTLSDLGRLSIQYAKGVGPHRARLLKKIGIETVEDAFWFLPWRYEDRSVITAIKDLQVGERATVYGRVQSCLLKRAARRRMVIMTVRIYDGTGVLDCVFFNQPFLEKTLCQGVFVFMTGVIVKTMSAGSFFQMKSPQFELVDPEDSDPGIGRMIPIYHETKGFTSRQFRGIMAGLYEQYRGSIMEILSQPLRDDLHLPSLMTALEQLHFPRPGVYSMDALNRAITPAHSRMAFEEVYLLQVALGIHRRREKMNPGITFRVENELTRRLRKALPFPLTLAQQRVIQDIHQDMAQPFGMNRLLQGDVGSGKTIVALHAMMMACGSGYQSVLMAPTEVLSEQHFLTLQPFFQKLGIQAVFVKGGQSDGERSACVDQLQSGKAHVAIGTHALLQPDVRFAKLGLVVVDEQHKFGVLQRAVLREKGCERPDVLIMTATPIPRTLAMTVYGDLDVSTLDELPPGRQPIQTRLVRGSERSRAYRLIHREIASGHQAYIVYPLVEPSEKLDLQAAMHAVEELRQGEFSGFAVGLLHGRMKSDQKQQVMTRFQEGALQILVATTVIEVGLDVPNATVMLVEHADRFGLAQLHQLRGRVGRGSDRGYCLLMYGSGKGPGRSPSQPPDRTLPFPTSRIHALEPVSLSKRKIPSARQRLEVLVRCADGFALAEEDLKIRGPGDVLGVRQWGELNFRVADVVRHQHLLKKARHEALRLLEQDPHLTEVDHQALKVAMLRRWQSRLNLGSVG